MSFDVGHLDIDLRGGVNIASTRPADLGRVFLGRTPSEARRLVPLLFAVCGAAQYAACDRALAAAEGRGTEAEGHAGMVRREAVREHLMRVAVDWGRAVGVAAEPPLLRRIHALAARQADGSAFRPEAGKLMAQLVGPIDVIERHGIAFIGVADTIAARLLRRVSGENWQSLGACADGDDRERSCLTLVRGDPLMRDAEQRHGPGLLARLFARVVHLGRLLADDGECAPTVAATGPHSGIARVATARGDLCHSVNLEDGHIARYAICAPTDVNFAGGGPANRSLAALTSALHDGLETPARLLVEAFDPCVPYALRLH